jgi:hypothetical protein
MLGRVEGKGAEKDTQEGGGRVGDPRLPDGGSGSFHLQRSSVKIGGQYENNLH